MRTEGHIFGSLLVLLQYINETDKPKHVPNKDTLKNLLNDNNEIEKIRQFFYPEKKTIEDIKIKETCLIDILKVILFKSIRIHMKRTIIKYCYQKEKREIQIDEKVKRTLEEFSEILKDDNIADNNINKTLKTLIEGLEAQIDQKILLSKDIEHSVNEDIALPFNSFRAEIISKQPTDGDIDDSSNNFSITDIIDHLANQEETESTGGTINRFLKTYFNMNILEDGYLLGCLLEKRRLEHIFLPKYVISEEEAEEYIEEIISKDAQTEVAERLESNTVLSNILNEDYVPYFIYGSVAPDLGASKTDGHHVYLDICANPDFNDPSNGIKVIKDQLHAIITKALHFAINRNLKEAYFSLGVFTHLVFDALIVSKKYKERLINYKCKSDKPDIDETRLNYIHTKCDDSLYEVMVNLYKRDTFNVASSNPRPNHINKKPELEIAENIDSTAMLFGCINIDTSNLDLLNNPTSFITYNGHPIRNFKDVDIDPNSDPLYNAIAYLANIYSIVTNKVTQGRPFQVLDSSPFKICFKRKKYSKIKEHLITLDSKLSNPYIRFRALEIWYRDIFCNSKKRTIVSASNYKNIFNIIQAECEMGHLDATFHEFHYSPYLFLCAKVLKHFYTVKQPSRVRNNPYYCKDSTIKKILQLLKTTADSYYHFALTTLCAFTVNEFGKALGYKRITEISNDTISNSFKFIDLHYKNNEISTALYGHCLLGMGIYYYLIKDLESAKKKFEEYIRLQPDNPRSSFAYFYLGKYEEYLRKNSSNFHDRRIHLDRAISYFEKVKPFEVKSICIPQELFNGEHINYASAYIKKNQSLMSKIFRNFF